MKIENIFVFRQTRNFLDMRQDVYIWKTPIAHTSRMNMYHPRAMAASTSLIIPRCSSMACLDVSKVPIPADGGEVS